MPFVIDSRTIVSLAKKKLTRPPSRNTKKYTAKSTHRACKRNALTPVADPEGDTGGQRNFPFGLDLVLTTTDDSLSRTPPPPAKELRKQFLWLSLACFSKKSRSKWDD